MPQRFRLRHKVRRSVDFLRCYRRGRRRQGSILVLYFHHNKESVARLGVTASRKVGKAVVRHRIKRHLREVFRCWEGRNELPCIDIVAHVRPFTVISAVEMRKEFEELLSSLPERSY